MVFALKQLISNALKYTKQGSIHIYMDDCLVIEDTGIELQQKTCHVLWNGDIPVITAGK